MQKFRKLFLTLIAALAALLLAAPLASSHTLTAPIDALLSGTPTSSLAVGDTWTYNITFMTADQNYTLITTTTVTGIVNIKDWNDTTVQCYNITSTPAAGDVNQSRMDEYRRTSDEALIAMDFYMFFNGSGNSNELYQFNYTDKPQYTMIFPLNEGLQWNSTEGPYLMNQTGYQNRWYGDWENDTYVRDNATQIGPLPPPLNTVLNISNVTVPAGTFETWCINTTGIHSTVAYYSPTVRNIVKSTTSTYDSELNVTWELLSYSFATPTSTFTQMMMLLLLMNSMQQGTTSTYIYIGAGAGIIIVAAAIGIILIGRRK